MSTQPEHGWLPQGTFVERLFLVRAHMGWDKQQAANACGVKVSTWSSWERWGRQPRNYEEVCRQIADASGCDLYWLMTGRTLERPGPGGMSASRCTQPSGPTPASALILAAA